MSRRLALGDHRDPFDRDTGRSNDHRTMATQDSDKALAAYSDG